MLKISKMTDYATVLLAELARMDGECSAALLAAHTHLPAPTVAKLLKQLVKSMLVQSTRGASGGYRLAKAADQISVRDVLVALEGPLQLTECAQGGVDCMRHEVCSTRGHWHRINLAVQNALAEVTLQDLANPKASNSMQPKQAIQAKFVADRFAPNTNSTQEQTRL
jgi:FeS assembly SUF system regulator